MKARFFRARLCRTEPTEDKTIARPKKSNFRGRQQRDMTRVNDRIRAPKVRVVLFNGDQLGVMSTREALDKAKMIGMDLIEIAANADPPVCRIADYGKYKYEQSKLKKAKSKSSTRMKEVKFRVRTGQHDYNIKMGRAETFLDGGHKVRIVLQFRGRENAHKELGFDVLNRIIEDLKTMAHVDQEPRLNGRAVGMTLSPLPEHQRKRHFHLYHGELIDEDDFEDDEEEDHEDEGGNSASNEEQGDEEEASEPAAESEK